MNAVHPVGGHIDTVFRNGLERLVGRRGRMPVELHIHAAGPLDDDIPPDRIVKWTDEHICAIARPRLGSPRPGRSPR